MATPRFAWGIDVGNRALKAIRLVRDGDQFRIDDFEVIEHEQILSQAGDNRDSLVESALANFAQHHPGKGGAVAIGVSGQASFARFVKLPPVNPSQIPEIVKFEAVQQIPFPLEEVEWSYQLFQAPDSPEVEVGIFAMRRDQVNRTIRFFTDVGLQVTTVQMNPLAVYNGLEYDGRIEGTTMIVDVGAENSDLIIAEGEGIWMRSIPIGGNNFTESLVKSFQLKFNKAEELKRNAATSKYGRQILQAMKPVFSDLVSEIQRSIGFYSSTHRDSRINKVLALGGTFRLPGLQKYLQQNLQLDVVRIDRLNAPTPTDARFTSAFSENILSAIGCYGLALQAMGQGKMKSSLLPNKIKRERMWKEKTRWFAMAASLFVLGTAVPIGRLQADKYLFTDLDHQKIRDTIDTHGKTAKSFEAQWRDIENSGADDRKQITSYMNLLTDRDVTIGICEEIGKAVPPPPSAAELKKPRPERQTVSLVGWTMRYETDITPHLEKTAARPTGKSDDEFNLLADKIDLLAPPGSRTAPLGSSSAAAAPTAGQRGYILTLLCQTPNTDSTALVSNTVVAYLRSRNQDADDPPEHFSIERVTIPSKIKLSTAYPNGVVRQKKTPLTFIPPLTDAAGAAFAPQAPVDMPAPEDPFTDPMIKGENQRDDSLVTVLALIAVDPPPPGEGKAGAGKPGSKHNGKPVQDTRN